MSYKSSVDHELLDNLVFMGKFDMIAQNIEVEKLIDGHNETFVKAIVEKTYVLYEPTVSIKSLNRLWLPMSINGANARAAQFFFEFFNRLNEVGHGKFRTKNPEQTV